MIATTQRYTHSSDERKRTAVELLSKKDEGKICDVFVTQENQSKLINWKMSISTEEKLARLAGFEPAT